MFIDSEKLVCLSFPGFGQVTILLKDVTARDSNGIVLMSLCPSATTASPILEPQEQQLCRHSPGDSGETASTKTQTQCCLSTALTQTFVPHGSPAPSAPSEDRVFPLPQAPWLPGRHKAKSTASHRAAACSKCCSWEQEAVEAAGCPTLPGQDLARYQDNVVMKNLFSMLVTQCHTLLGKCPVNFTNSVPAVCVDRGSSGFQQQQNHPFLPTAAGREEFYLKKPSVPHFPEH